MADSLLTFRDASTADVAAVVALVESAYRGEASQAGWTTEAHLLDGQRTDADDVGATIARSGSRLLLASRDEQLVGCCNIQRRDDAVCYFGLFAVSPVLQGGGVGRQLLAEAERIAAQDWHAQSMHMTVISQRRDLIAWYLRRGYTETAETRPFPHGDERFGLPRRDDLVFVVLTKALPAPTS